MDFVHDQLATGLRVLTIVDIFSRFSPVLQPRFTFRGSDVVAVLERARKEVGFLATIRVNQGSEFVSRDLDLRSLQRPLPGRMPQHSLVPQPCGQEKSGNLAQNYNEERPYGAIGKDRRFCGKTTSAHPARQRDQGEKL